MTEAVKTLKEVGTLIPPLLALTTVKQLEFIVENKSYARSLSETIRKEIKKDDDVFTREHYDLSTLQINARIILARIALPSDLKAGDVLSPKDFSQQAFYADAEVKNYKRVYRFDLRHPFRISAAKGFWPNSEQPVRTLIEHSLDFVQGSGNFISTTTKADNLAAILNPILIHASQDEGPSFHDKINIISRVKQRGKFLVFKKATTSEISIPRGQQKFEDDPRILSVFEYKISNASGVATGEHGVKSEEEVVTAGIPAHQITEYREVNFVYVGTQKGTPLYAIDNGPWTQFPQF